MSETASSLRPSGLKTPWRAVASMFAFNGALFGVWASRIPAVADRHALGHGTLGLLLLLLAFGAIAAFPLAGRWADRRGAATVTRILAVLLAVTLVSIAVAPSVPMLAVALVAFGAAFGAMDVAMNSWGTEVERALGRPVMSSLHAMFSLGAGLGAASGWLAAGLGAGLGPHFLLAALVFGGPAWGLSQIGWQSLQRKETTPAALFPLPRGPLLPVGIAAFCTSLGEGAIADWSALYLADVVRVGEGAAALGYAAFSVAMVTMRLLGDGLILRFGAVPAARVAGAISVLGIVLVAAAGTLTMSLAGFALVGLGYALIMPLAFSRAAQDPQIAPGAAIARVATLGYGGLLLGPPIIGFLAELTSLRFALLVLAALGCVIIAMAGALRRPA